VNKRVNKIEKKLDGLTQMSRRRSRPRPFLSLGESDRDYKRHPQPGRRAGLCDPPFPKTLEDENLERFWALGRHLPFSQ
jgi:hypothetical protein